MCNYQRHPPEIAGAVKIVASISEKSVTSFLERSIAAQKYRKDGLRYVLLAPEDPTPSKVDANTVFIRKSP